MTPSKIISDDLLVKVYTECGNDSRQTSALIGLSPSQINKRIRRIRLAGDSDTPTLIERETEDRPNHLEQVLKNGSFVPEAIGRIEYVDVGEWGGGIKNKDGEWEEHGLYKTMARLRPHSPKFALVQPAEVAVERLEQALATPRTPTNPEWSILHPVQYVVGVSDAQIGYLNDVESGLLEPTHDPRALEIERQAIAALQPRKVVGIGDWMDWPVFGRWQKRPEYQRVTQTSIQCGFEWKLRFKLAAPADCEFEEIGSNHQMRPETFILEYNREASGLRRAVHPDDKGAQEWPVFSEPFLLRYDMLGIHFSGQYPGGEYYIFDDLVAMHAPPKSAEFDAHVWHGHTHRLRISPHVVHSRRGRFDYLTYDIGCTCAVDSTTNEKRLLVTKVPSDRGRTDYIQGFAVAEYLNLNGTIKHQTTLVRIDNGLAMYGGQLFDGRGATEPWLEQLESVA